MKQFTITYDFPATKPLLIYALALKKLVTNTFSNCVDLMVSLVVEPVLNSSLPQKLINMNSGDKTKLKIHFPGESSETIYDKPTFNSDSRPLYDFSAKNKVSDFSFYQRI